MFKTEKYASVVWLKGGRLYPDIDCFGIVNEIRSDLGLSKLPDFSGVTKDDNGLDRTAKAYLGNMEKCDPEVGALALCYSGSTVTHVAIVISLDDRLHVAECNPGTNVSFLPLPRFIRRFNNVEFWR